MKSDQTVQCDVLTHGARLYMLYEWVFRSHKIRRRSFFRFRPQDKHTIFHKQRDASLNPCDSLSHRSHTSTLAWRKKRPAPIEDHNVAFVNHPRHCRQGLSDYGSLKCHSTWDVASIVLFCTDFHSQFYQNGRSFHLQGRCPFAEPFDGFRSTFVHSSGFTTDSPAPGSTVISRYRPRLPSGFNRIAVDGHVADRDRIQFHLFRQSLFTRSDFNWYFVKSTLTLTWGVVLGSVVIGKCWLKTPNFWQTEQRFALDTVFGSFCVQGSVRILQNVRLLMPPIPTIEKKGVFAVSAVVAIAMFSKLPATHFCVPWNPCLHEPRNRWQRRIVPVVSSEDSSTTTSSSMISPWSDSTSKDPISRMPHGTFCDDSCCSSSHFLMPFLLGAEFGSPPLTWVLAPKSALMWPTRPQRKHSMSVSLFSQLQCCLYPNHTEVWWRLSGRFWFPNGTILHLHFPKTRHFRHRHCWPLRSNFPMIIGAGPRVRLLILRQSVPSFVRSLGTNAVSTLSQDLWDTWREE